MGLSHHLAFTLRSTPSCDSVEAEYVVTTIDIGDSEVVYSRGGPIGRFAGNADKYTGIGSSPHGTPYRYE